MHIEESSGQQAAGPAHHSQLAASKACPEATANMRLAIYRGRLVVKYHTADGLPAEIEMRSKYIWFWRGASGTCVRIDEWRSKAKTKQVSEKGDR